MKVFELEHDIKVFYVTAASFPEGIKEATDELHSLVPFSPDRKIFGLSRPENGGGIIYRAAAEELEIGEAGKLKCDTLIIKKGSYYSITINDFRKNIMAIDAAFKELLKQPDLDPEGYCVEWYATNEESVRCMIRIKE
ncbi:MAG: transcriptional regulator [Bacteroidota bacterium]